VRFHLHVRSTFASMRRHVILIPVLAVVLVGSTVGSGGASQAPPAADPGVIPAWNATAVATIVVDAGKANAEAFYWYAIVQAAVYNAVVGITREYELYRWDVRGPRAASPEAAAAAAAHHVLLHYFPASQARLDAALATSLSGVSDGTSESLGVAYGHRAADRIIQLREGDGRYDPVTFDEPLAPGVWRPTPPAFAPFFAPWLATVRPFLLRSPSQFRPGPPPALTSAQYTADFNEVKAMGAKTGSSRTPAQTTTALFFSDIAVGPVQASLRDLVTRHGFDISQSARVFAAVDLSLADSLIASWDSKLLYGFWRPVTAIDLADTDGNPDTERDAAWEPLIPTPPYPDYPSGLTPNLGALTRVLSRLLGNGRVDLNITSVAAGLPGPPLTRHYEYASTLNQDVIDARVWLGIHFRTADVAGSAIGTSVGDWALDHYFRPN